MMWGRQRAAGSDEEDAGGWRVCGTQGEEENEPEAPPPM